MNDISQSPPKIKSIIPKRVQEKDDNALIEYIRDGNPEAFSELVARYEKKLLVYIKRFVQRDAEACDLLQDVFIKVLNNLDSFDTTRKFSSWIYRITHNETVNYIKKKTRQKTIQWEDFMSYGAWKESDRADTPDLWLDEDDQEKLKSAIEQLPPKHQEVVKLKFFDNKSYKEISKELKKPVNSVGTLINRAKKILKKIIKEMEQT